MQITQLPEIQMLRERKITPVRNASALWLPLVDGLNRVRRGGYAYNCEDTHAYPYIRRTFAPIEMCDLNEVLLRPLLRLGYMSHKRSPYLELLKTKFRKLRDGGVLSKFNRLWLPPKPPCLVDSFVFSVGMEYVGPLFVFLAGSMGLCGVLLVGELWVGWRVRGRRGGGNVQRSAERLFEYGYQP